MSMAGVTVDDIDVAEIYDSFTITVLLTLESLGFCKPGEAKDFVAGGRTAPGGEFPMNTSGGGLAYTHPGMTGSSCSSRPSGGCGGTSPGPARCRTRRSRWSTARAGCCPRLPPSCSPPSEPRKELPMKPVPDADTKPYSDGVAAGTAAATLRGLR